MTKVANVKNLRLKANQIRQDLLSALVNAKSGHTAGALGMADVLVCLYFAVAHLNSKKPRAANRDRIVLSNGHICPVLYAALANRGFFPRKELSTLRKLNSRLQGHPHYGEAPGVENSSGPLGQGVSIAAGMALAAKIDGKKHRVYLLLSDGELQEGQTWEALMFCSKYKLDNLCAVIDRNYIQISGCTENVMPLEPLRAKLEAFNWKVIEINGHDYKEILNAFTLAKKITSKPTAIIANTTPGKGVSFMEGDYTWHGKAPSQEEYEKAIAELTKVSTRK